MTKIRITVDSDQIKALNAFRGRDVSPRAAAALTDIIRIGKAAIVAAKLYDTPPDPGYRDPAATRALRTCLAEAIEQVVEHNNESKHVTPSDQLDRWRTVLGESCDPEPERQSPVQSAESLDGQFDRFIERLAPGALSRDLAVVLRDTRAAVKGLAETVQALAASPKQAPRMATPSYVQERIIDRLCDLDPRLLGTEEGRLLVDMYQRLGFSAPPAGIEPEPLPCGCPDGRHPNHVNSLQAEDERHGWVCHLGWPQKRERPAHAKALAEMLGGLKGGLGRAVRDELANVYGIDISFRERASTAP